MNGFTSALQKRTFLLLLAAFAMPSFLTSCSINISPGYQNHQEIPPVALSADGTALWKSSDLSVQFQYRMSENVLKLDGSLRFDDAILYSFPVIEYFSMQVYAMNDKGKRTAFAPIKLHYLSRSFASDHYLFNTTVPLSEAAAMVTFSYRGEFADYGERYPDTNFIYYAPPVRP